MRFANKTALLTHIKELHNARTEINCTLCDFVAVNKEILDKHMKIAMGHKIQKECFQFRNGSCLRGRFCKFLHQQNSRNANDMMDENIRQNNNWNRNNTGYSNLQRQKRGTFHAQNVGRYQNQNMNGNNMQRNNTGFYNTQQKRGTFPAQNVRRNQNAHSIRDNMNNHIQGGYTNKQCKYMENCFNFPNCGFSH